ncbi:ATP-binding protein [Plantibacter sp. RU18]|uniref:ATP-binding protein n=1 Tax=Plantibacter sp. RU18 TaxID=3158143 RepID=UPI003D366CB5
MDFDVNPFRPGAGRVPPELAGRSGLISEFSQLLYQARETGEGQRPWILSGLRGVGKTALLNQLGREAVQLKLVFIKVEATRTTSLSVSLSKELHLALRRLMSASDRARELWTRAAGALKSFQLRFDPDGTYALGLTVEAARGVADSGDLAVDVQELFEQIGEAARDTNTVLVIAVDELQEAPINDLTGLNVALHALGQAPNPVPVMFIGAGLPSLPAVLADATSYAERLYDYRQLGLLDETATASALEVPTRVHGVMWDEDALAAAVRATGGYPYFIQALGSHVWLARTSDQINADDVALGSALAQNEVDQGLYQSRWERATPQQRAFMEAMSADNDSPSALTAIATRVGKKRSGISVTRDLLIRSGHIYAPDRGYVAFTVPGMASFIRRQRR